MIHTIEKFTAAIQLITAVNFTFILTHFPNTIYKQVLDYDVANRKGFKKFNDNMLIPLKEDINNMNTKNDEKLIKHKQKLAEKISSIQEKWKEYEQKSSRLTQHISDSKGFKCLFLFVSVYCVFDLIAIPALNLWNNDYLTTLISLINLASIAFTVRLSWIICRFKWNDRSDRECYNRTIIFLLYSFLGILPVWAITHFAPTAIWNANAVWFVKFIWGFDVWSCLLLPFYPFLFSISFVFGAIWLTSMKRAYWKMKLRFSVLKLKHKKRKIEKASDIISNFDWR